MARRHRKRLSRLRIASRNLRVDKTAYSTRNIKAYKSQTIRYTIEAYWQDCEKSASGNIRQFRLVVDPQGAWIPYVNHQAIVEDFISQIAKLKAGG